MRAHIQIAIWKSAALESEPSALDPAEHGWERDDRTKCMLPVTLPPNVVVAQPGVLDIIKCGCTADTPCFTAMCGCYKAHFPWTLFCGSMSGRSELPERAYSTVWLSGGLWQLWLVWRLNQIRNVLMTHTYMHWCDRYRNSFIWLSTTENMGVATKIILISCVVIKMLTKTVISVMAAVICIFSVKYWS